MTEAPPRFLPGHGGNIRQLARQAGLAEDEVLDFSANINPLGPPAYSRQLISACISSLGHYPDPDYEELRQAAAAACGGEAAWIVAANGSSELIYALPRALSVRRAVIPAPSYIGYAEGMRAAGVVIEEPETRDNLSIDWPALEDLLRDGDLLFLGHPNNPSGRLLDMRKLEAAAKRWPAVFFVVDEAFIDFVENGVSAVPLIRQGLDNVIVLRSLTKFYAVPGLRLGYGVACRDIARLLEGQLPPWRLNTLAAALGARVINDRDYAAASRKLVAEECHYLTGELALMPGLEVLPGAANYLLIRVSAAQGAAALSKGLLRRGIALRLCDNFSGLKNYLRIAIRTRPENERLLSELSRLLGARKRRRVRRPTPALMLQGVASDAGKSIMTAALARILLEDGIQAAPFKSQNMSLNSFVTNSGGEMGRAQVVQAQACRLEPDTRMNPILLKPCSPVGSQVIVNGRALSNMTVDEYIAYKPQAFAAACAAYDSLSAEHEVILLEGAGSPGEVNLKSHDIVNMNMARYAGARVLIVGDIDRGGVFASFIGTMAVLEEWERRLVAGFIVNRFRGQESLLTPALEYTKDYTGCEVLGVVPWLADLGLPEEDSVSFKKGLFAQTPPSGDEGVEICLIDLPHISNFTDFEALRLEPDVQLRVVSKVEDLGRPQAVLLPGSKNVLKDLQYLQRSGMAEALRGLAASGIEIVGICGGFQMLGREIADPHNIEAGGVVSGLGLLPLVTELAADKTLRRQVFIHRASGLEVRGYEIHHGRSTSSSGPVFNLPPASTADAGACQNSIWGSYLHGIFDADPFRHWFVENLRRRRGLARYAGPRPVYDLEPAFDRLAAVVRQALDMKRIYQLLGF